MSDFEYDLFIIGGGVNGCGIARDAAGRGYKVGLAEMADLASGTSSAATKLVHGGLRYLEHYEFSLVRESLGEREVLWAMAPHLIWPLRFVLPYHKGLRPWPILRAGLFLYDYIGGRKKLPATRTLDLRKDEAGKPLKTQFKTGFEYSDCWVDDARFVTLNARDAADKGADIFTRTKVISARQRDRGWSIEMSTGRETRTVSARMIVNAAGPWVDAVRAVIEGQGQNANVRLVKGSHIVVNKLFDHHRCYIFQNGDGRIIFAIPYEGEFTLIGTTDQDYAGDPTDVAISSDEINYLCEAASEYFAHPVTRGEVVWAYSGVRPLYDDGESSAQEASRDYILRLDTHQGAPLLNVFGGKLTTSRHLSEEAVDRVSHSIGAKGHHWTAGSHLPGGDFGVDDFETEVGRLNAAYPFIARRHARRLTRAYGTKAHEVLADAKSLVDLGETFGADLTAREVDYLVREEWARSVEDILWRRSKLGLHISERDVRALQTYMEAKGEA